jgi:hypothetical protein
MDKPLIPLTRRHFMLKMGALLLTLKVANSVANTDNWACWAGAAKQGNDYWLMFIDARGQVVRKIKLPSRAHGLQQSAQGQLIICGRRPGSWLGLFQHPKAQPQWINAAPNRPLSGHCCFSPNGHLFFSAENALDMGQGVIGIWHSQSGQRLSEWLSHGVGPHEILISQDRMHLWVANGGILTHPDHGREKLNLNTMNSNMSCLSLINGGLSQQYTIEEPKLSMRHIAINQHEQVAVACQYQGPVHLRKNLLLLISEGQIKYLSCEPAVMVNLNNYLGSVTFDRSGMWIGASSPRGNRVVIWHLINGLEPIHYDTLAITDACGLSASNEKGGFIISTGMGYLYHYLATTKDLSIMAPDVGTYTQFNWDNHLTSL